MKTHKEQTVIKHILLILISMSFFIGQTQSKLNGVYHKLKPLQEHYEYFKFESNGVFEYHKGASLGDSAYGKGNYSIKQDTLILTYNRTQLRTESFYKSQKYINTNDSITLTFKVKESDGKPLEDVNVFSSSNNIGAITNKNGEVKLRFKKSAKEAQLVVSHLEFRELKIDFSKHYNYNFEVYLIPDLPKGIPIYDTIEKFIVINQQKNHIILLDKDGKQIKWVKQE